jgi:hypothetical protein
MNAEELQEWNQMWDQVRGQVGDTPSEPSEWDQVVGTE